ncbi:MAG: hypothetical protein A3H51_03200 [Candidatus Spechtbacteria bacterium RIFCSPLOWO2_02_FULL_38_8]|uniref:TrbC/VIRB2 family protein n=1 Tax=Candidatus Spechtbacteria bacterium RIFCSPLOWO2_02_FULL_38_8 TaxID=1802164 RepID=A0A1G2HI00_9BACT|nr:MAG: hypothetical protein A3H51_03200 [Candidatus Spechtbacteria bacterium RIFCSPLOWO2_02_FULL_38_8]
MKKAEKIFNRVLFVSVLLFLISLLFSPQIGLAVADTRGGGFVDCGGTENPCTMGDFLAMIHRVVDFAIYKLAPLFVVIMIVVGGFFYLTSAGNTGQTSKGKSLIKNAVIGYAIVLSAWLIVNTILTAIGVAQWTGLSKWWEITL